MTYVFWNLVDLIPDAMYYIYNGYTKWTFGYIVEHTTIQQWKVRLFPE